MGVVIPLFIALVLKTVVTVSKKTETGLRIYGPPLAVDNVAWFTCSGLQGTHALVRISWVLITGQEEQQINDNNSTVDNVLHVVVKRRMAGSQLICRAHSRQQVMLAPPIQLWLQKEPEPNLSPLRSGSSLVVAQIGDTKYTEEGSLTRQVGDEVHVTCGAVRLPTDNTRLYIYVLLRNDRDDIETEISGAQISDTRLVQTSGRLTVRAEHHKARVYCLARWFNSSDYDFQYPSAVRSAPLTLVLESPNKDDTEVLWIAVGVGSAGWLAAVILLVMCLRLRKQRNADTPLKSTKTKVSENCYSEEQYDTVYAVPAASPPPPPPPTTPPPPGDQRVAYCNVQELNTLMKRKLF